jgi:spore germination protein GerM
LTPRRAAFAALLVAAAVAIGWVLFVGLPRWYTSPTRATAAAPSPSPATEDVRKIKAHLFYVSEDGTRLSSVERDVPFADQTVAQARRIIEAQLAPVDAPFVSAIPQGTTLRAVFLTEQGAAFVDLSREVTSGHPGGSINELLTIYTIVQALTTNLPAVTSVQLLVDGKEVDTLAGHVDIRRPLPRADQWVAENAENVSR